MTRKLKPGDRVRMKVRTIGGWKGTGTVIYASANLVHLEKDGPGHHTADVCDYQVAKLRDQTR